VKTGVAADEQENWFGHDRFEALSNLIFTAVDDAKAAELMSALKEFSDRHAAQNPIHALQLDVEHAV